MNSFRVLGLVEILDQDGYLEKRDDNLFNHCNVNVSRFFKMGQKSIDFWTNTVHFFRKEKYFLFRK